MHVCLCLCMSMFIYLSLWTSMPRYLSEVEVKMPKNKNPPFRRQEGEPFICHLWSCLPLHMAHWPSPKHIQSKLKFKDNLILYLVLYIDCMIPYHLVIPNLSSYAKGDGEVNSLTCMRGKSRPTLKLLNQLTRTDIPSAQLADAWSNSSVV